MDGAKGGMLNYVNANEMGHGKTAIFGAAFHLHNWFADFQVMRNKYFTYGHSDNSAMKKALASIQEDVGMMVRCVHGMGNVWHTPNGTVEKVGENFNYYVNNTLLPEAKDDDPLRIIQMREQRGWGSLGGNRPIFFHNRSYVQYRHERVTEMVIADEEEFGMCYDKMAKRYVIPNQNQNYTNATSANKGKCAAKAGRATFSGGKIVRGAG